MVDGPFGKLRRAVISDALFYGRRLRALNVVEVMTRISSIRGAPGTIRVDNGPEFASKVLDRRAYENAVTQDVSRPRKVGLGASASRYPGFSLAPRRRLPPDWNVRR